MKATAGRRALMEATAGGEECPVLNARALYAYPSDD